MESVDSATFVSFCDFHNKIQHLDDYLEIATKSNPLFINFSLQTVRYININ